MLKKITPNQQGFLDDGKLFLEFERLLKQKNITSLEELEVFIKQNHLHNLAELAEFVRSPECDFDICFLFTEIINRIQKIEHKTIQQFYASSQVGEYLIKYFNGETQEKVLAIYLDTKNHVIAQKIIFIGSLNKTVVHPREVFRQAILLNSAALILAHNHPSGDTTPSVEDLNFSKKIKQVGETMGISVLDHFIVGQTRYMSLREQDLI